MRPSPIFDEHQHQRCTSRRTAWSTASAAPRRPGSQQLSMPCLQHALVDDLLEQQRWSDRQAAGDDHKCDGPRSVPGRAPREPQNPQQHPWSLMLRHLRILAEPAHHPDTIGRIDDMEGAYSAVATNRPGREAFGPACRGQVSASWRRRTSCWRSICSWTWPASWRRTCLPRSSSPGLGRGLLRGRLGCRLGSRALLGWCLGRGGLVELDLAADLAGVLLAEAFLALDLVRLSR